MTKVIDCIKSLFENFAKQTSLNALLLTGLVVAGVIYWRVSNDIFLYVAFGCFVFLVVNSFIKYAPKWHRKWQIKRFMKKISNPKIQKRLLSKLDAYDLDVLRCLYECYPDMCRYNAESPVISKLQNLDMLVASNLLLLDRGTFDRLFTLQPWVKRIMDNNKEFISGK